MITPPSPLRVLGLLAAGCLALSSPGMASAAPGAPGPRILRLLDAPESLPREADWAPLGPGVLEELLGLVRDPSTPEPRRTRAVAALAVVAHPEAASHLEALIRDASAPPTLRAAATLALGRRAGLSALPSLTPLLEDANEGVRAHAARALGRLGGSEARRALENRLTLEEHPAVREALQQGLCDSEP